MDGHIGGWAYWQRCSLYQHALFATAHLLAIVAIPSVYLIYSKFWFS